MELPAISKSAKVERLADKTQELEDINAQAENATAPEERNQLLEKAGKLEEAMDKLESKLGIDDLDHESIANIYEDMIGNPKSAHDILVKYFGEGAANSSLENLMDTFKGHFAASERKNCRSLAASTIIAAMLFVALSGSEAFAGAKSADLNPLPDIGVEVSAKAAKGQVKEFSSGKGGNFQIQGNRITFNGTSRNIDGDINNVSRTAHGFKVTIKDGKGYKIMQFNNDGTIEQERSSFPPEIPRGI